MRVFGFLLIAAAIVLGGNLALVVIDEQFGSVGLRFAGSALLGICVGYVSNRWEI